MIVIVIIVVAPAAMKIAIVVFIPTMIVLEAAMRPFPVTGEVTGAIVMGRDPDCAFVRRTAPIAFMPPVVAFQGKPIALNPDKLWSWAFRANRYHARRGRRADLNTDRDIGGQGRAGSDDES